MTLCVVPFTLSDFLLGQDLDLHRPQAQADHPRWTTGDSTVDLVDLQTGSRFYRSGCRGAGVVKNVKLFTVIVNKEIDEYMPLKIPLRVRVRDNQDLLIV